MSFPLKAINTFQIRTLASLGFMARVTLNNKSNTLGDLRSVFQVDVSVITPDLNEYQYLENVCYLNPNSSIEIDCKQWYRHNNLDQLLIFHLIPIDKVNPKDKFSKLDFKSSFKYARSCDHYVEYYLPNGYSSGVLYQCGAFNFYGWSKESTTVMQAPKMYISKDLDTYLSIIYSSVDFDYIKDVEVKLVFLSTIGKKILSSSIIMQSNSLKLISIKNLFEKENKDLIYEDSFFSCTLLGICQGATLIPITILHNKDKNTIALEHSLPPIYYAKSAFGNVRSKLIKDIIKSGIFD